MKPVKGLDSAPPKLALYLNSGPSTKNWVAFHQTDTAAYTQLRDTLVQLQHALCGYCEQILVEGDCQVEHVIPRSSDPTCHSFDLDPANLLAACKGGSAGSFFGADALQPDPSRVGEESCGQAKGNIVDSLFIDPRNLPISRLLFKVSSDGGISPDQEGCRETGISEGRVERTIEILGLDVDRLKSERQTRWHDINAAYSDYFDDPEVMRQAARAELLPDERGVLPRFYTTNRSYFASFGESVLAESIDIWV